MRLESYPDSTCQCNACISRCKFYPGWPTVAEARATIQSGLGDRLMKDYFCLRDGSLLYVLCPAVVGSEGEEAPFLVKGDCTFLKDEKCSIHNHESRIKPSTCRKTLACKGTGPDKRDLLDSWDTREGRTLIDAWDNRHVL